MKQCIAIMQATEATTPTCKRATGNQSSNQPSGIPKESLGIRLEYPCESFFDSFEVPQFCSGRSYETSSMQTLLSSVEFSCSIIRNSFSGILCDSHSSRDSLGFGWIL